MEETTTTASAEAGKRPTFLTVLCILSFIAAGIMLIIYALGIVGMGAATAMAGAVQEGMSAEASAAMSSAMAAAGPSIGMLWANIVVGFLTTLVGLWGVIKMWKLAKIGFFVYTGCQVVSIIMGFIVSGFSFWTIVAVLFIVLYGLNLKHLK